jgi:hypothetical protein
MGGAPIKILTGYLKNKSQNGGHLLSQLSRYNICIQVMMYSTPWETYRAIMDWISLLLRDLQVHYRSQRISTTNSFYESTEPGK